MQMIEVNIPFAGFYETKWADIIDSAENREIEYTVEERQAADGIAEELRLDESELWTIYNRHSDYSAGYDKIVRDYIPAIGEAYKEALGFDLKMSFVEMTSPREYNFETDRLFVKMPLAALYLLFRRSRAEGHATLAKVIRERFTSRDGFISFYSNVLTEWLKKPLADWDHNEAGTLLRAALEMSDFDEEESEWSIYYNMAESDYEYYDSVVDWAAIEKDIEEARAEKAEELKKDDPDYEAPPLRCDKTIDLLKDI